LLILGLTGFEHDSAAVLLGDDGVVAAIEEDKLARMPKIGGIPRLAIQFALRRAGARPTDLTGVALSTSPRRAWLREESFRLQMLFSRPRSAHQTGAIGRVYRSLNHLRQLHNELGMKTPPLEFEHHMCHAASAWYCSPFDRGLVLTLDEKGDMCSGQLALGEGDHIRPLRSLHFPNSFGWFYTQVTKLLGMRPHLDEGKVQWLACSGAPEFLGAFRRFFRVTRNGLPHFERTYFGHGLAGEWSFSAQARRALGLEGPEPPREEAHRAAIARSAQDFLEEAVVALAERFRKTTGANFLTVAGGVFLNVPLVRALETRTGFSKVFAQPVAGNPGTALGAAHLAARQLTGRSFRRPLQSLDWGPDFDSGGLKAVLDNSKIIYRFIQAEDELLAETVLLLLRGKIVAWCQGRLEFGLRALGNRSLLASPFSPYVVENLNRYIKHREGFHPFALAAPSEDAPRFFDASDNCRFLASVAELREGPPELKEFCFRGREVRFHLVEREANPRFWKLLRAFGAAAPAPVLVNASFNLFGEPLVSEPRDAVRSFYCSGTDALVLGNFLVTK
jgi:carbamoyltransferase